MKLPLGRIAELIRASGEFDGSPLAEGYSIDSRTVKPGELFFAVKGDRLDGHDYVDAALKGGAVAAVVRKDFDENRVGPGVPARRSDENHVAPGIPARRSDGNHVAPGVPAGPGDPKHRSLLRVDDTLVALQTLGTAVRRLWGKTVVGITGSAGKTTTKDAIAQVLSARLRTLKSEGNLNNHFGLPLQLLRLEPEHEIAVFEMGMSRAGEITALAAMAQPQIGVVTNVAPVHLEFFQSIAGIARAKYELVENITPHGTAVLNYDDEYVSQFGRDFNGTVIGYGVHSPTAEVRAENIRQSEDGGSEFDLVAGGCREHVRLALLGQHNVYNALAAASVGMARQMKPSEIAAALGKLAPAEKRGEVLKITGATVVNDCYNSNPKALQAMVDSLAAMPARRRIVVAGEMLELGPAGPDLHRECGQYMSDRQIDLVIGVRGLAMEIVMAALKRGVAAEFLETPELAGEWLAKNVREGDAVLLKASRGVRLERALEKWKKLAAD